MNLWSHQQQAVEFGKTRNCFALFHETGTGKTLSAISILYDRYKTHKRILRTLILCPLIVCENWKREFDTFGNEKLIKAISVVVGTANQKLKALQKLDAQIFIMNIDSINVKPVWDHIQKMGFEILVCDESHRFKTATTLRTKKIIIFADRIPFKFLLSGSPVTNTEMDLWGQFRILSPRIFPENFYIFRKQFFYDANANMPKHLHFPKWTVKKSSLEQFKNVIDSFAHVVKKNDVLDLPPLVRTEVYIDLTTEQEKHYRSMEENFITYLDDDACTADLALTKLLRLQQIICGIIRTEQDETLKIESCKLKALSELLEDLRHNKTIVWCNFVDNYHDVAAICDALKLKYVRVVGDQKLPDRQNAIDSFQRDPEIKVMIANQAAGGIGINLTAASYMIYFNKGFNLEHDIQSEARCYRGGSEIHQKITRIDIIAKDTVDEEISLSLKHKTKLGDLLLSIKDRRKAA